METNQEIYDALPGYELPHGQLTAGYQALARRLLASGHSIWLIDGMSGMDWAAPKENLQAALAGHQVTFIDVSSARLNREAIRHLLAGCLDNGDSVFARLYPGHLIDFFDPGGLAELRRQAQQAVEQSEIVMCLGQGSALLELDGAYVWADLPKEIITDLALPGRGDVLLGTPPYLPAKSMYWVDWPVMERHKTALLDRLAVYLDMANPLEPVSIDAQDLKTALAKLAHQPFRVKPVFYPGAWGGQWMKQHMQLDPSKPNYAWSYELITPENGVVFCDGDLRLEVPFEILMAQETLNVQGPQVAERFGASFPIRFNYDDTIEGGNLSCQVHPQKEYAAREFGLAYTQDETYYILRAGEKGLCYLGLKEGIDPQAFRRAAERARDEGVAFDTEEFVNAWPTRPHDLFLIPSGTIHNSGANNVVLEVSSTPYLYTFKIYDYLRRDLSGNLRPIHIERAWDNIDFTQQAQWVRHNLIPSPRIVRTGEGWTDYLLCDQPLMFFAIHRIEFGETYDDDTRGERFHALNLVEGDVVQIEWAGGTHVLRYAESIVIPAAVGAYRVRRRSSGVCKIVKAYVKELPESA